MSELSNCPLCKHSRAEKLGKEDHGNIERYKCPICGAYRVDKDEHNERIDDKIIMEIKNSIFLVADATHHNQGVYFEAGFAHGLDRPVIWCVRKDDLENVHFDTRQINHIVYENSTDLKEKLYNRICATIGKRQNRNAGSSRA